MNEDVQLRAAIDALKSEPRDRVFEALRMICDEFGWELSYRDPGPDECEPDCEIDAGWCHTHETWIDEHAWKSEKLSSQFPFSSPAELTLMQ